ncbi:hypothetical protein HHI36_015789 [Cryptolaemus montrouzieri]|uniref:Uncharacterized protein n=1 Tax=Cryptolaemus montrouzieri TaxID=559131 RepID=A0ABD2N6H5_9CUCU
MDPYPEVSSMCSKITTYIRNQAKEFLAARELIDSRNSSMSLPPSPNRGNFLSGDSPPNINSSPLEVSRYASRTLPSVRTRKYQHSTISEDSEDKTTLKKTKRLVSTAFVEWSSKYFAQAAKRKRANDIESKQHYEREWRFIRNSKIRREAKDEQRKAISCKLECQVFNTRTSVPPSILKFHPYDQQIAVAGRNGFSILDWGTGAKNTTYQNKSLRVPNSNISALEWINGHDVAMLMVGVDDGSVKVFKPNVASSKEPRLITSWQAFNDLKPVNTGLLLCWEQRTQTLITAGDSRVLRFWDADKELKAFDLVTGTDSSITCIDSSFANTSHDRVSTCATTDDYSFYDDTFKELRFEQSCNGYVVVGCADGSVRLFDRRCAPMDSKVKVWMEHGQSVLGVQLLRDNLLISAGAGGDVKLYDIRKNSSINTQQVQNGISCFDIHNSAGIYSCGSVSQSICIYNLQGNLLNSIRFYEGFMGHRIGPINCLSFHPHKVVLATGTADCSVSVYCLEGRR